MIADRKMQEYRTAKQRIIVAAGESVRMLRELQGLSLKQLAQLTGISQATLCAIEGEAAA